MLRTCLCSLAGAAIGFFLAIVLVAIASGGRSDSDTGMVIVFLGGLLAVGGAIAGAVIGGAADLVQFLRSRDQAQRAQKAAAGAREEDIGQ